MGAVLLLAMLAIAVGSAAALNPPADPQPDGITAAVQPDAPAGAPAGPAVNAVPVVMPAPSQQVRSLLIKQARHKIVLYRKSAWHWQRLLGQRRSPGGNIWNIGNPGRGNKLAASWRIRSLKLHRAAKKMMSRRIQRYRQEVQHMNRVMGAGQARALQSSGSLESQYVQTRRQWRKVRQRFVNPPQKSSFLCIHGYEGSWRDRDSGNNGHYGGVQFGKHEWLRFGYPYTGKAWAYEATPLEQLWAASRYWQVSGFHPWPQTARNCGLL